MATFEAIAGVIGTAVIGAALLVAIVALAWLAWLYVPRFHFGAPPNWCEFRASRDENAPPFNRYHVKWWFGFSHRPKPSWFLGIMRWDNQPRS